MSTIFLPASRRQFLTGCTSALAAAALARWPTLTFGAEGTSENRETLVVVFLRGGMDGLSLVPPIAGDDRGHYEVARPNLKIPLSGAGAALRLTDEFGLHPSAEPLLEHFQGGRMAVVHAVGTSGSRSHFDAMKYLELGTPGVKTTTSGWLTRHLRTAPGIGATVPLPALAAGNLVPTSLLGSGEVVNMYDSTTFSLGQIGHPSWAHGDQWSSLRRMCLSGDSPIHQAGLQALNAAGLVESYVRSGYQPAAGVQYPAGFFGTHLKLVAQLVKSGVGLRVATVDHLGWDTHENQGNQPTGHFSNQVKEISGGLAAFLKDLDTSAADAPIRRVTVVVVSEFGRRVRENANLGTDHGTANVALVLGGQVRGGIHGRWPGLHQDQQFDNADLAPTTDLRQVLGEIMIRRLGNPRLGEVFPKYQGYAPLGVVAGDDLPPDYSVSLPVTPSDFTAVRVGPAAVRLSWGAGAHATNYLIERRLGAAGAWAALATLDAAARTFEDLQAPVDAAPAYRLRAYSASGEGEFSAVVQPASVSPLAQWRLRYFGTDANSGAAANDAVSSADGLSNFTKYALGLDPKVPADLVGTGMVPGRPRLDRSNSEVALVYVRPADRTDVRYEVLRSDDLEGWAPVSDVLEATSGGWERRRAVITPGDPSAQFLKLTVAPQ